MLKPMALTREAITMLKAEEAGFPLLEWISGRFSYHTPEVWTSVIESDRLTVNGSPASPQQLTAEGDVVQYFPATADEPTVTATFDIVHEDDDLLVINKPPNLPCHPGGSFFNNTLWALLKETYDDIRIINRLDRETSGLVLVARNKKTAGVLGKMFAERHITKEYLVIVEGDFPSHLQADGVLSADDDSEVRKKRRFSYEGDGDTSSTSFDLVDTRNGLSLVKVLPKTGRLHQIRATLKSLGHPVVGDKIYGIDETIFIRFVERGMTDDDHARLRLSHQALHACRLTFTLPKRGTLSFSAPMPGSMAGLLRTHGFTL